MNARGGSARAGGPPWPGRAAEWSPVVLVWSCLLLLPFGRLVEVPVAAMALAGLVLLWRNRAQWRASRGLRLLGLVFLAAWLPILVSAIDAVHPARTALTGLNHLRFFLSGVFVLYALHDDRAHARFLALSAWWLAFWVLDALVQIGLGRDLLGYAVVGGRVNALFGEDTPAFSLALAVLCPLLWEHARRRWPRWAQAAAVVATVAVVLIAGTRSAWISVSVVLLAYVVWRARAAGRAPVLALSATALCAALGAVALYQMSTPFAERVDRTVGVFTGETDPVENAIGHRLWIWKAAVNMFLANPVNGVGARGFRHAFAEHASPEDPYLRADPPVSAMHSHQLWLEVLAETGLVGALGLAVLLGLLIAALPATPASERHRLAPYGLCLLAAYFPLNTHMAVYSSFWAQILWWLIALYCAAHGAGSAHARDGAADPWGAPAVRNQGLQ